MLLFERLCCLNIFSVGILFIGDKNVIKVQPLRLSLLVTNDSPPFEKSASLQRRTGICFWVALKHRVLSACAGRIVITTSVWRAFPTTTHPLCDSGRARLIPQRCNLALALTRLLLKEKKRQKEMSSSVIDVSMRAHFKCVFKLNASHVLSTRVMESHYYHY